MSGTIYWAGGLFDHKELIGNLLLSNAVSRASGGKWTPCLPQNSEVNEFRATCIRDDDYRMVTQCDAFVGNFDGTDLDSGTVAEFLCAKALDIPAVLLRTDFRICADRNTCPDPWNLMLSGFPRTKTVFAPAMPGIDSRIGNDRSNAAFLSAAEAYLNELGKRISDTLDEICALPPLFKDEGDLLAQYRRELRILGGSMPEKFSDNELKSLVERKMRNGIYRFTGQI